MNRISVGLWLAVIGAVLSFVALGSNFYEYTPPGDSEVTTADAWFGVPHTSQLLLAAALIAVVLTVFTAAGRSLFRGRTVGIITAVAGLVSTAWLGYRMLAPPFDFETQPTESMANLFSFDHCLWFCPPSQAIDATLLPGIWFGFIGGLLVLIGGLIHIFSPRAAATPANFWVADRQSGLTPWLTIAALGALGQFIFGYTFFPFYIQSPADDPTVWTGWLPTPHTSMVVLWGSVLVVGLVIAAARNRAPVSPAAMGGLVAAIGLVSGARILYRMIEPPFGGGTIPAELQIGAYLSIISAVVLIIAALTHGRSHRQPAPTEQPKKESV
jgi:hypothetical protein